MRPPLLLAALLISLEITTGCIEGRLVEIDDPEQTLDGGPARITESYVQGWSQVDLLFVLDNTPGMAQLQSALAGGIGSLLDRLAIAKADWRIGVISTDLGISPHTGPGCMLLEGDGGMLQNLPRLPGCEAPQDRYITRTNVLDPVAAFACIALLGDGGCGFEQPMAAVLKALGPQMPAPNQGFLRDGALLMVVFVSNEDDCSAADPRLYDPDDTSLGAWTSHRCFARDIYCTGTAPDGSLTNCSSGKGKYLMPVASVAEQLTSLKPEGALTVTAIVGPPAPVRIVGIGKEQKLAPSCSTDQVEAVPAIRIAELIEALGSDGALVSACDADLGRSLAEAAGRLRTSSGPYCLGHPLKDPTRPACTVTVTLPSGSARSIPPSTTGTPGFRLVHPLVPGCENGAVDFDGPARPPPGSVVQVSCDFASKGEEGI